MKPMVAMEMDHEEGDYGPYDNYEIEGAVRTLKEAEEIKADPKKMKYVKMCMAKEMDAMKKASEGINSIDDIRAVAKKKLAMGNEYE